MQIKNVVALKGADGLQRALIINALREKANGDRESANEMEVTPGVAGLVTLITQLREQANMADARADGLE